MDAENNIVGLRKRVGTMSKEQVEDELFRMHEENFTLKKKLRIEEESVKRLTTKIARLQKSKASDEEDGASSDKKHLTGAAATELFDLQEQIIKLTKENEGLKRKVQLMTQNPALISTKKPGSRRPSNGSLISEDVGGKKKTALPRYGQSLLEESRKQVLDLQQELSSQSEQLKDQNHKLELELARVSYVLQEERNKSARLASLLEDSQLTLKRKEVGDKVAMLRLNQEVAEKSSHFTSLQAKFEILEGQCSELKNANESLVHQLSEKDVLLRNQREKISQLERQCFESKNVLSLSSNGTLSESTSSAILVQRDRHIDELTKERDTLKRAHEALLSSAFDGEREKQHAAKTKLLQEKINKMEEKLKQELVDRTEVLGKLSKETELNSSLQRDQKDLRQELVRLKAENEVLSEKVSFFSRETSSDLLELQEAVKLLREKKEYRKTGAVASNDEMEALKKDLREAQAVNAESVLELDKARRLLSMQNAVASEYQAKISELNKRIEEYDRLMADKSSEFSRFAEMKGAHIAKVESQLKDIAYGTLQVRPKSLLDAGVQDGVFDTATLARGQNILEIHISRADLNDAGRAALASPDARTFVTFDFYEHETSSTSLRAGYHPVYESSSQFTVSVDDRFLHYLQKGSMALELHVAMGTEYRTLGIANIRFLNLLSDEFVSGRQKALYALPIHQAQASSLNLIGELHVWLRFHLPVDYALRHYREKMKARSYALVNEEAVNNSLSSSVLKDSMNGLVIDIESCLNVKGRTPSLQPSIYVAYQFHTCEDFATPTIRSSNSPQFSSRHVNVVSVDDTLQNYLLYENVEFLIIDDEDPDTTSYLGTCLIPLASLAQGQPVQGSYKILTDKGDQNGVINVKMYWQSPYQPPSGFVERHTPSLSLLKEKEPLKLESFSKEDEMVQPVVDDAPLRGGAPLEPAMLSAPSEPDEWHTIEVVVDFEEEPAPSSLPRDSPPESEHSPPPPLPPPVDATSDTADATRLSLVPRDNEPSESQNKKASVEDELAEKQEASKVDHREEDTRGSKRAAALSNLPKKPSAPVAPIIVVVESLKFSKTSPIMTHPKIRRLFVSYNFLGVDPAKLETPSSLPKSEKMQFDFKMKFCFDDASMSVGDPLCVGGGELKKELKQMIKQIRDKKSALLLFDIVSEPLPQETEAECENIGFASVDLAQVFFGGDWVSHDTPIYDSLAVSQRNELVEIGSLTLTVLVEAAIKHYLRK